MELKGGDGEKDGRVFISPVYDALEVNIPHPLMQFSDEPFPEGVPLFPGREEVRRYLWRYAEGVSDLIRYETQVESVDLLREGVDEGGITRAKWKVGSTSLDTREKRVEEFDAVAVASGHYAVPMVPKIEGLERWAEMHKGSVVHSKYYRRPEDYAGKRVIVVGNSASGLDISTRLTTTCETPLYLSQKSVSEMVTGFNETPDIETVQQIVSVDGNTRTVTLKNGNNIGDVDVILFCTGYLYSLPFLEDLIPNPIQEGSMVHGTYEYLLLSSHPSLSLLVLGKKIIPFPMAEAQAAVLARVYSGRLALPSVTDMQNWEKDQLLAVDGSAEKFHVMDSLKDAAYINHLVDWATKAEKRDGLENDGVGKVARAWGAREIWIRKTIPTIRKALMAKGEDRFKIRTFQELGVEMEPAVDSIL